MKRNVGWHPIWVLVSVLASILSCYTSDPSLCSGLGKQQRMTEVFGHGRPFALFLSLSNLSFK